VNQPMKAWSCWTPWGTSFRESH